MNKIKKKIARKKNHSGKEELSKILIHFAKILGMLRKEIHKVRLDHLLRVKIVELSYYRNTRVKEIE